MDRASAGRKCGLRSGKKKDESPELHTAIEPNQFLLFGHKIMAARSDYPITLTRYSGTRISGLLTNFLRSPLPSKTNTGWQLQQVCVAEPFINPVCHNPTIVVYDWKERIK